MKTIKYLTAVFIFLIVITSCSEVSKPSKATPITDFQVEKYLGTWYEIARLDHKFEKNLNQVSATYALNENGTISVLNKGYNVKTKKWEEAEGKAKFVGEESLGRLKVSFFGPFYGGYNIVAIDDDYNNALVVGNDLENLWFLSRNKQMPKELKQEFLNEAERIGYDTSKLIWVVQK